LSTSPRPKVFGFNCLIALFRCLSVRESRMRTPNSEIRSPTFWRRE